MEYQLYEVGGKIRDEILGLKSKDVDYSVVIKDQSMSLDNAFFEFMKQIHDEGFDVKTYKQETLTVRAMFPEDHKFSGVADFVLARKELYYPEGSRVPVCALGTLKDDLERRDFTVNALAKDEFGEVIDMFDGRVAIKLRLLDTPKDPVITFQDDPLRIIRAMRFAITKGFFLSRRVKEAIKEIGLQGIEKVSVERVREELEKCFYFDTVKTLNYLMYMRNELGFDLIKYAFDGTGLRLEPTNKK
jgi:tRNA nucleotidyltransferase/poly(A) polymerase